MKKSFLFLFLFLIMIKSNGQSLIVDKGIALKPGFYKSFEEFKTNSPSLDFNYTLKEKPVKYGGIITGSGKVIYYQINIDKKKAKTLGKVYGFCDGKNVYIYQGKSYFNLKSSFVKIEYLGRYCYYKAVDIDRNIGPSGSAGTSASLEERAIDINTGGDKRLNKLNIKEILEKDTELLSDFNNEKKKGKALKEYIVSYSDKHEDEIIK